MAASNAGVFRGARISSTRVPRRIRNITSEELIGYNSLTTSEKPGSSSKETVVQQLSSLSQICSDPVVGVLILKKLILLTSWSTSQLHILVLKREYCYDSPV